MKELLRQAQEQRALRWLARCFVAQRHLRRYSGILAVGAVLEEAQPFLVQQEEYMDLIEEAHA